MTPKRDEPTGPPAAGPEPGRRRRAERRPARLEVRITVARRSYAARTLDLSRTGVRLELTDEQLRPPQDARRRLEAAASLERTLGAGFDVAFSLGVVHAQANIVRVELPREVNGLFVAGCRFAGKLTEKDCRRLGLALEGDYEPTQEPLLRALSERRVLDVSSGVAWRPPPRRGTAG